MSIRTLRSAQPCNLLPGPTPRLFRALRCGRPYVAGVDPRGRARTGRPPVLSSAPRIGDPRVMPATTAAAAAAAAALLLHSDLASPPEALAPLLQGAAAELGPSSRVYVHIEGSGDYATVSLLEWLARLYRLVADLAPRLDVIPLLPFAGWDRRAVATLEAGTPSGQARTGAAAAAGVGAVVQHAGQHSHQPAAAAAAAASAAAGGNGSGGGAEALAFQRVAVGGTFDRLHAGHRLLLAATALVATQLVYVGVTADELLAKKAHREWLQAYDDRAAAAVAFMQAVRPSLSIEAGALRDPAAPTQAELDAGMQALVVSRETLAGGEAINRGRVGRGFGALRLVVVGVVGERPDGSKLSSSELRERDATGRGGGAGADSG